MAVYFAIPHFQLVEHVEALANHGWRWRPELKQFCAPATPELYKLLLRCRCHILRVIEDNGKVEYELKKFA
jgi:hypothetical protein